MTNMGLVPIHCAHCEMEMNLQTFCLTRQVDTQRYCVPEFQNLPSRQSKTKHEGSKVFALIERIGIIYLNAVLVEVSIHNSIVNEYLLNLYRMWH